MDGRLHHRRAVDGDFVAELADFRRRPTAVRQVEVADDEDGSAQWVHGLLDFRIIVKSWRDVAAIGG